MSLRAMWSCRVGFFQLFPRFRPWFHAWPQFRDLKRGGRYRRTFNFRHPERGWLSIFIEDYILQSFPRGFYPWSSVFRFWGYIGVGRCVHFLLTKLPLALDSVRAQPQSAFRSQAKSYESKLAATPQETRRETYSPKDTFVS